MRTSSRCFECLKYLNEHGSLNVDETRELKKCSGCSTVFFCDRKCQSKNWQSHKDCCNVIKRLRFQIEKMEKTGEFTRPRPIEPYEIEIHKGCNDLKLDGVCVSYVEYDIEPEDPYLKLVWKKQCLAYGIYHLAETCDSFPLYENHLDLILEIMTMSAFGFCEMQISLTMTLLAMKKDNQAWNVVEFMMMKFQNTNSKILAQMMSYHKPQKWLNLNELTKSEMDLFQGDSFGDSSVGDAFPWYSYIAVAMTIVNFNRLVTFPQDIRKAIELWGNDLPNMDILEFEDESLKKHLHIMLEEVAVVCDIGKFIRDLISGKSQYKIQPFYYDFEYQLNRLNQSNDLRGDVTSRRIWRLISRLPDLLKMIKDKVDESFGKSKKKFGCDYVNEGFMGFDIGHDDFICGDLKCECGRPKPLFHSVRPHKVHLTDKIKLARKFIADPTLTIKGTIHKWSGTYGYMKAKGEAEILGDFFVHKNRITSSNNNIEIGQLVEIKLAKDNLHENYMAKEVRILSDQNLKKIDDCENNCNICLEPWCDEGSHRISSLKCGHFFGFSCIEKWLSSAGGDDCPNCNEKASINDIRQHYVSNLHGSNGKIHGNR